MNELLRYALLGLGAAAAYAVLAQGLVVVHRGTGVVNFAGGAIAFWGAWTYVELRPSLGLAAALVGVLAGAVLGAIFFWLVIRRLRRASPLARLIATLGLLATLRASALLVHGPRLRIVEPMFTPTAVDLHWATVGSDRLALVALATVLTAALHVLYRRTRFGRATTAVAEDEVAAGALGWSPVFIGTLNWALGCGLSAAAGVLVVHITGLAVTTITLLVVPALAAALLAHFRSFPITLAGGLGIGILEFESARFITTPGVSASVPFIVIIGVLAARGSNLPVRGHLTDRLPAVGDGVVRAVPVLAATSALVAIVMVLLAPSWSDATTTTAVTGLICLSLVVVTGFAGQLSLAQFSLAGIGAWVAGSLVDSHGVPFELALLAAVAATVPVGLLVGAPSLRSRGVNLAITTLGFALMAQSLLFGNPQLTGGPTGIQLTSPSILGIDLSAAAHPSRYAVLTLLALVGASVAVANLRRGRTGRRFVAVRTNERAAAALGINVATTKLCAFGISAGLAALGGVLLAFRNNTVLFNQFDLFASINVVMYAVIGGIGFVTGALLGAPLAPGGVSSTLMTKLVEGSTTVETSLQLAGGVLLVVVLAWYPDGFAKKNAGGLDPILRRLPGAISWPARPATVDPLAHSTAPTRVAARHLATRDLSVTYGGVRALRDLDLDLRPGAITGLIGPNGAGKTTAIDAISGFVRSTGRVEVDGTDLAGEPPHRRSAAGIGRSFQALELFDDLTVRENLLVAEQDNRRLGVVADLVHPGHQTLPAAALAAVRTFGLADALDLKPTELPFGRRRLIALARAAAGSPAVLLLDEPAAGLDVPSRHLLGDMIRRLADEWGMAVLLVEHDVELVLRVSDQVIVLHEGRPLAHGRPDEIRGNGLVADAYLGRDASPEEGPRLERIR